MKPLYESAGEILGIYIVLCWSCHKRLQEETFMGLLSRLRDEKWGIAHDVWCCPRHLEEVEEIGIEE